jgi:hypothetical protein
MAATSGWTSPNLDNSVDPNPADAVLELSFEATRPQGIVLQVLSPISVSLDVQPSAGADAVIVSARTNSITVHSSEFIDQDMAAPARGAGGMTTMAIGEEGNRPGMTTLAMGEEGHQPVTTYALGEEGRPPQWLTSRPFLEETLPTTHAFGEEGRPPITSPASDDPVPPYEREWGPIDPWGPLRGPFGSY